MPSELQPNEHDSRPPQRVLLAPWGHVESTNGSFILDAEAARLTLAAFAAHGTDLPIDYEHQTLGGIHAAPDGRAPAAGWVKSLHLEPGVGLFAEVVWTAAAQQMLAAREYRFLSPVAIVRKSDRRLVALHSAALTNKPAIVGMKPIVCNNAKDTPLPLLRSHSIMPESTPHPEPHLSLDDDEIDVEEGNLEPHEHDVVDHEPNEALTTLRAELSLAHDASAHEVLTAATHRLGVLRDDARRRRAAEHIRVALRAGKLIPAQRAWAESLIAQDESLFVEWLRSAPAIVVPGSCGRPAPGDERDRRERTAAAQARAEYRAHAALATLTSEEAYIADARRMLV